MIAVAASPEVAKKVDTPQNVGQEFVAADAAKGNTMARKTPPFATGKALFAGKESKAEEAAEKRAFPGKKAYAKAEAKFEGEKPKFACGGKVKKFADGGDTNLLGRLNKPAKEGYQYRSPAQTNAKDLTPHLREDVVRSQAADTDRIRKGYASVADSNAGRRVQSQAAGARALTRTAGRALGAAGALQTGWGIGRAIDEKTGVGRKMVDAVADRLPSTREGVKLSADSERRLADERIKPVGASESAPTPAVRTAPKSAPKPTARPANAAAPTSSVREGANANIDAGTRARAMKAVEDETEGMKKGGAVKKLASGGAVRGTGAAKRGFGRGKMC